MFTQWLGSNVGYLFRLATNNPKFQASITDL